MELTGEEQRVLGCLIEKSHTTPDQYPLSTNSLRLACNQKTSREPIVDFSAQQVDAVVRDLRDAKWARSVHSKGSRGYKHRHVVDERLGLSDGEEAILAVLLLRGPQSASELANRTERYRGVDDASGVLVKLAERGLARNVGRVAGQSQDRWVHLLGSSVAGSPQSEERRSEVEVGAAGAEVRPTSAVSNQSNGQNEPVDRSIDQLLARIAQLEERVSKVEHKQQQR